MGETVVEQKTLLSSAVSLGGLEAAKRTESPGGMHSSRLPASLRALRHRNFRLFWTGQLVSLIGTWMQQVARGWLVLELTHSAFWLGMVGFANSVPVLLLSLWAGAVVDRVSKRRLIIVTQVISMFMAFTLAVLTYSRTVQVTHILAISLIVGAVFAFDAPARQSFTVDMVGKEDLMNAVALNSSIFNGARVLGPAIGAIALAWQGPALAFLLNGFSYLAVIAGLLMMDMPKHVKIVRKSGGGSEVAEGLRFALRHETIGVLLVLVAVVSVFAFPYSVLMPIFADQVLHVGKEGYGLLMAFSGVGSLIGAVSMAIQSGRPNVRRGLLVAAGAVGLPVSLALFALSSNFWLCGAFLVAVGLSMIWINATVNTVIQTNVPDELRGRVNGVFAFLFVGMAPLGNLQAGVIADHFGTPAALVFGALICALAATYLFVRRRHVLLLA